MGKSPLPLWTYTRADVGPTLLRARRPLEGSWLDAFAQVEENLGRLGIGNVDDCEIWEVAARLGANAAPDPEAGGSDTPREVIGDPLAFRAM